MKRLIIRPDSWLGRIRHKLPRLLLTVILIALFLQVLFFVTGYFFPEMTVAKWGEIEHGRWLEWLILREEKVIYPSVSGKVNILVGDAAQVRTGDPLAEVINPSLSERIGAEGYKVLNLLVLRLEKIEKELEGIERDLEYHKRQLTRMKPGVNQTGTLASVKKLENQKKQLLMARDEILRESEALVPGWQGDYQLILAEQPGVFFRSLDGGEGAGFEVLQETKNPFSGDFTTRTTHPVKPIGKMITGRRQWLVCKTTKEIRETSLEEGESCFLVLEGARSVVTYVGAGINDSDFFWIFEDRSFTPELLKKRVFQGYLVFKKTSGVRIPRSALKYEEDAVDKAYTLAFGKKKRVDVEVLDKNEEWAVVKGLSIGTPIYY